MTIRNEAKAWLRGRMKELPEGRICTTKIYPPEKSWTNHFAWWIEIPLNFSTDIEHVWFILQKNVDVVDFYVLKIPSTLIKEKSYKFYRDLKRERLSFFIS